ncbi:N-acetylglucosamine kinase [Sphingomonas alpina]|uniref:N-acetylglucosamine kinase n=1 Tax=Sphingomonas alpina TaxID=653931 RepID=A0A7H0LIN8_9SPHN|nr:BadF/BadG/BcrA/BcrD ATPase family protein [Sphingomonas alpina]QNQ09541.1 N-acetylglucosamine kinase [Sphingomonas alpina]
MTEHTYFLGVDGGGSKTEFVCIDATGTIKARALTGTTYHLEIGMNETVSRLEQGVAAICGQLDIQPDALGFVFFGLPAYGEDSVIDPQLHAACRSLLGHERYLCGNDMVCGWAGSLGCQDGINIVAGTGSIAYGERQGKTGRAGGWGEVFGDEGSAYWIAVQGLALFSHMSDGRAPKGVLHQRIVEALSLGNDLDLCQRIMGPAAMGRSEIAALAGLVSRAAADGDTGANAILASAAHELAALAISLRTTLSFPPEERVPLSWSGGVLLQEPLVRNAFAKIVDDTGLFALAEPLHAPGYGGALYAKRLAHTGGGRFSASAHKV